MVSTVACLEDGLVGVEIARSLKVVGVTVLVVVAELPSLFFVIAPFAAGRLFATDITGFFGGPLLFVVCCGFFVVATLSASVDAFAFSVRDVDLAI